MKQTDLAKEAGAVVAAAGLQDAKASSPASSDTVGASNEQGRVELPADGTSGENAGDGVAFIDGAELLDECLTFIERFVVLPSEAAGVAMVVWAAHTHLIEAFDTTPRMAFLSAEPSSGKTRAMEIMSLLCRLALETSNATPASIMRAVEDPAGRPSFFIDEIDTVYGKNGKGDEDLRGLINAGHRRDKGFLRCVTGEDGNYRPQRFEVFAAVAMAGIGNLPDTILTRSVNIKMRKRARHEKVESFRHRDNGPEGAHLQVRLAEWANQVVEAAKKLRPHLPEAICDRNADVWEPLIVVGDLAGGDWPEQTRNAALGFVAEGKSAEGMSLGVQLLRDIHTCVEENQRIASATLVERLTALETGPWANISGKPIDPVKLAALLRPYGIEPGTIRLPNETPKGYKRTDFVDAWNRYLP